MTTAEIILYYANLLILQYRGQPKAFATVEAVVAGPVMDQLPSQVQDGFNLNPTVQTLTFSAAAASGSFSVSAGAIGSTPNIFWNDDLPAVQLDFDLLYGPGEVSVSGSVGSSLTLMYSIPAPTIVSIASNTLLDGSGSAITISVATNQAVGVQLDVLGKYVGVTRSGFGPHGPVTLSDSDFLLLIQMAIISNTNPSDLATIVGFLNRFFPGEIQVIDESDTSPMEMTYLISTSIGDQGLIDLFVAEGLLPKPMGVGISVIEYPTIDMFFGYCDYRTATPTNPNTPNTTPYNTAGSYSMDDFEPDWVYMDYDFSVVP